VRGAFETWDDYFIPGTTVLRNKHNETDAVLLRQREEDAAQIRLTQLAGRPIEGAFDFDHMKAIHRHIFQDTYEWAGQSRVVPLTPMTKAGPDVVNYPPGHPGAPQVAYAYYPGPAIAQAADAQYAKLAGEAHLKGLDRDAFVGRLAEHWGEINTIHAFREGNTRSQFAFFSQLATNAGYQLDAGQFARGAPLREAFVQARFYNQATGRSDRLEAALKPAITATSAAVSGQERAASVAQQHGLRGVGLSFPRGSRPVSGASSPGAARTKPVIPRDYGVER